MLHTHFNFSALEFLGSESADIASPKDAISSLESCTLTDSEIVWTILVQVRNHEVK